MSYILDALRKSEQQRQATQPDNVTDRILVNQPQSKPKPSPWLLTLIIGNVLAIAGIAWFFMHKPAPDLPEKTAKAQPTHPPATAAIESAQKTNVPSATSQAYVPATPLPVKPSATSPSIAQMIENTKVIETPKPAKKIPERKPLPVKKELTAKTTPKPMPEPAYAAAKPVIKQRINTPELNELTNDERSGLPNLTVNVFSYAQEPEDRFVIIDMVKYKTGQLVKGQVKLKEIRPDSIVLENDNGQTFKVERP